MDVDRRFKNTRDKVKMLDVLPPLASKIIHLMMVSYQQIHQHPKDKENVSMKSFR